jgi:hypothetical protein
MTTAGLIKIAKTADTTEKFFANIYNKYFANKLSAGKITSKELTNWNDTYYDEPRSVVDANILSGYTQMTEELKMIKARGTCSGVSDKSEMLGDQDILARTELTLDGDSMKESLASVGLSSSGAPEAVGCSIGSLGLPLTIAPGSADGIAGRVRRAIKAAKVISSGANGVIIAGEFSSQEKKDATGLFVIKGPIESFSHEARDGVHEAFVGFFALNPLRNVCPNFMYTYAAFRCAPPIASKQIGTVASWCSTVNKDDSKNITYTVLENLADEKGKVLSVRKALIDPRFETEFSVWNFFSTLAQLVSAFATAWKYCEFTHYDLHEDNVVLTPVGDKRGVLIPYNVEGQIVYVLTQHIATVIDYGMSHVKIGGKSYGKASEMYLNIGVMRNRGNQFHDIFKFIGFSLHSLRKEKVRPGTFAIILKLLRFFTNSNDESLKIVIEQRDNYFFHPHMEGVKFDYLGFLKFMSEVARESGLTSPIFTAATIPQGIPIWKSSHTFVIDDFRKTLDAGLKLVERLPFPTTFGAFNDLVFSFSLRFGPSHPHTLELIRGFNFNEADRAAVEEVKSQFERARKNAVQYMPLISSVNYRIGRERGNYGVRSGYSAFSVATFFDAVVMVSQVSKQFTRTCLILSHPLEESKTNSEIERFSDSYINLARDYIQVVKKDADFIQRGGGRKIFGDDDEADGQWKWVKSNVPFIKSVHSNIIDIYNAVFSSNEWLGQVESERLVNSLTKELSRASSSSRALTPPTK